MAKIGLAMELFGKKQSELNPEELRVYYREAKKRQYIDNPQAVEKRKQRSKKWRETHKEQIKEYRETHREESREYFRQYRKSGKALDYTEVYKRAFDFLLNDYVVKNKREIGGYYIKLAKDSILEEKNE